MKLQKWLDKKGITQTEFAARIGVTKVTVCRLCNEETEASPRVATAIFNETKGAVRRIDLILSEKRKAEIAKKRVQKK